MRLWHPAYGEAVADTTEVFVGASDVMYIGGYWRSGYANLPASQVLVITPHVCIHCGFDALVPTDYADVWECTKCVSMHHSGDVCAVTR
jgi:hypothetical protein